MLPIKLEMKNFLPYRQPEPILFEGIHLACLTGANGAGKSSVLDAITYALWGEARSKRDDDLIHLGESEMSVSLDFEQEGNIYRVHRQRTSGKRGATSLTLYLQQEQGHFKLINEPNLRDTQKKLEQILRLDYKTFVASAFLQQGKADAFMTKQAAERKKLLSEILGLERWQVYEERAKKALKDCETQLHIIEARLNDLQKELDTAPAKRQELQLAQESFDQAERDRQEADARLAEVQDAPIELKSAQEQYELYAKRQAEYQQDLSELDQEISVIQGRIRAHEDILAQSASIQTGYQNLRSAREYSLTLGNQLEQLRQISERHSLLSTQLNAERTALEKRLSALEAEISSLRARIKPDTESELARVSAEVERLEGVDQQREDNERQINALRENKAGIKHNLDQLKDEGVKLSERIQRLEGLETSLCPLCGQVLDDAHRQAVLNDLNAERADKRAQWTHYNEQMRQIEQEITQLSTLNKQLLDQRVALPRQQALKGALSQQAQAEQEARQRLNSVEVEHSQISEQLVSNDYAHSLHTELSALEAQRAAIGYDSTAHQSTREALDKYASFDEQFRLLKHAEEALPQERDLLHSKRKRINTLKDAIAEQVQHMAQQADEIKRHQERVVLMNQRLKERKELSDKEHLARQRLTSAQQELYALEGKRERVARLQQERDAYHVKQAHYEQLRLAFSKHGVPTMLIEAAIPELEASANDYLVRMTDGRLHLRLTTQQEKADGQLRETLEIEIADELGTRPYENYSGGEAFRVNFALRVALSELLARRAGAHLRTLFVDEGFGTQDAEGRTKLVEVLNAIQDRFDMILVITHIDELRDAFPVHIQVDKTSSGSRIMVR